MSGIEWGGHDDCAQTRQGLPPGTSPLPPNHTASIAIQHLVETGLRNWSIVLDLQRQCGTSAAQAKDAAQRFKKCFSTRDEHVLMHAARLWLILLCYQPPHAPVQSGSPSTSTPFVNECNDKDFLSTIQKLVSDKTMKKSPNVIRLFVRIVATAASQFGGEFDKMRPVIEAKSPERVILLFQPSDEIFYPTTGWADKRRRGRDDGREPTDDDSSIGHPTLMVHNTGSSVAGDYVVVDRDQMAGRRPVSQERRRPVSQERPRPVSQERRTPEPESIDPVWKVELKMARETGELLLHTLQTLSQTQDLRHGRLPFNFVTDLVHQCESWKQQLSDSRGGGGVSPQHQRYLSEPASPSNPGMTQIREVNEAMKALDDALNYYARLGGGASPGASSHERHQRTATAPSSSTNARPSPSHHLQQPTAHQQLHVITEHRPGLGSSQRTGPASLDGHDLRPYRHHSPSGHQPPPSPTAASYHGHTNTRYGPPSLDGHEYRTYRPQQATQAPAESSRPQPATWSKGQYGRR